MTQDEEGEEEEEEGPYQEEAEGVEDRDPLVSVTTIITSLLRLATLQATQLRKRIPQKTREFPATMLPLLRLPPPLLLHRLLVVRLRQRLLPRLESSQQQQ